MRDPAHHLAAGLLSAGLLASGLSTAATASAQQAPPAAGASQPAGPAAAPLPATPAPDAGTRTTPTSVPDPTTPLLLDDPVAPLVVEPQTSARPAPKPKKQTRTQKTPRKQKAARDSASTKGPDRQSADESTAAAPAALDAIPGAVPAGVPSFFIDSFRVPIFLLPIYQAAGIQYGVRWEILAAINEIETDYGRNVAVSSAGALGWMQFMPPSWQAYGVDANRDGRADPSNPIDAIFAAGRYLQAAGAQTDLRKAIFAYNHADWYVNSVLQRAQRLAALPVDLVSSLSALAQGRPPLLGEPRRLKPPATGSGRARTLFLSAPGDGPAVAVAVADGRLTRIGRSPRLGRFVQLRDDFGNTYTYGGLTSVARSKPTIARPGARLSWPAGSRPRPVAPAPTPPSSAPQPPAAAPLPPGGLLAAIDWAAQARRLGILPAAAPAAAPAPTPPARPRVSDYDRRLMGGVAPERITYRPLREGSRVVAGTVVGRRQRTSSSRARVRFEIRPAGRTAPRIDPRPIVAGWRLLLTSNRGAAPAPLPQPSIGQAMLLSKQRLQRLVLDNPAITIYPCGRDDIRSGRVDRRVLATLQLLADTGLRPTVSSLSCGHSLLTSSGNVSAHPGGNAVDISAVNGVPISGNQGPGSITEATIRRLLTLQGTMAPNQIISLMRFEGAPTTLAMSDHADHIHVGFPLRGAPSSAQARLFDATLDPPAWRRLIARLAAIRNPRVSRSPSSEAIPAPAAPAAARAKRTP